MRFYELFDKTMEDAKSNYNSRLKMLKKSLEDYSQMKADNPKKQVIDRAISSYSRLSIAEKNETKIRRYNVIKERFLNSERKSAKQISRENYTHIRTVFNDTNDGIRDLMPLIF
ncbi:MAG: hypothetical protein RR273_01415, partial [Oscillospiraceae bacterium]